jgi:hypothetical protein
MTTPSVRSGGTPDKAPPVLNTFRLDALIDGDGDFLDALVDEILFTIHTQVERIERAISEGRPTELRLAGETLRITGETIGARRFVEAARAVSEQGKSGVMGGAMEVLSRVRHEAECLAAALREYVDRRVA